MLRRWSLHALVAAALVSAPAAVFAQDDSDDDGVFDPEELYPDTVKADGRLITDALYSHSPLVPRSLEFAAAAAGIEVPGSNRFDLGTWTIECWVRAGSPTQTCALIERRLIADPNNATFRVGLAAGVPYAEFVKDGYASRVGGGAGQPLPLGAWTHVAAVFDDPGNSLSLYLNGGAKQAVSAVVACPRGPGVTTVGDGFVGHLDELRVWSAARTAAAIAAGQWTFGEGARFNAGAGGSVGGLVAYYPFDDGGNSAEDYTRLTNWAYALPTAAATTAQFARVWGDLDDDADGLPDWWERMFFASGDADPDADDDGDGLENRTEYACDTNPFSDDSDGNGVVDAAEDADHDGLENRDEQFFGTDPRLPDTDDDGLDDLTEAAAGYDPADSADPAVERALVLDGAPGTFVELPQDARFRLPDWTIEAWVQPTGAWAQAGTVLRREVRPGDANYALDLGATLLPSAGFGTNRVTAATPLPAGGTNWVYLAATYDSASRRLKLFVNGARVAEKGVVGQPRTSGAGPIVQRIGEGFAGRLNEVRVWSAALGESTIAARDLAPLTGAESGLAACYTFDDGTSYAPGSLGTSLNPAWVTGQVEDRLAGLRNDWRTGWRHAATLAGGAALAPVGTNVVPNLDFDGDGMPNAWEALHGLNPVDPADAAADADGDGLTNLQEFRLGLDPNVFDADGDGDGMPNPWELGNGLDPADPADTALDPDGDGLSNLWEYRLGLDPNTADTDGNGVEDGDEDADADGMPNAWEIDNGLDPLDAGDADADPDGDGLSNLWEFLLGLNPNLADSDGDGTADGDEDSDGDRLSNAYELAIGTDPADPDSDDDGFADGDELDANVSCGGRRLTDPLYSRSPVIQRSLVLDGTARAVPAASADEPDDRFNLDAWTVECWVYPGSTSETGVVIERTTARGLTNFCLRLDGNVPSVQFTSRSGNRYAAGGTAQIPAATWSYVAGVWSPDEDSLRLYVNGALYQAQQSVEPCEQGTNGTTRVGAGVNGYLDALRVWSKALSSAQIHGIYDRFGAFLPASFGGFGDLVAWYPFDDGQNADIVNPLSGRIESHGAEDYTRFLDWDFAITGVTFSAGVYADLPGDYDVDADGMPDWWEAVFLGGDADPDADADGDGVSNLGEYHGDTNPNDADTDNDGVLDGQEDTDADGLTDAEEELYGADSTLPDTDDDGVSDNDEVSAGTDPTDALDAWHLRALSLPGSATAYAELPRQARFALTNWTVEAWVRPASDWVAPGAVIERSVAPDQGNYTLGIDASRHIVAGFGLTTVTTTNVVPADGETWTHLAASFDALTRRLRVCVDGSEVTNRVLTASPRTSGAGPLVQRIGGAFNGLIDDVRVWSTVRTDTQLAASRSVALLGTETGLVAYYMFDDGTSYRKGLTGTSGRADWITGQAQDTLAAAARDWNTQWSHAATLRGGAAFSANGEGATVLLPRSMTVSLRPEAVRDSNAQWRVWLDGDWSAWQSSGDVVRDLSVGAHSVEYTAVTGWLSPTSETVTIVATAAVAQVRYYAWLVGDEGTAAGAFDEPRGLAADTDYLYVADSANHRVQRLAFSNGVWTTWGGTASGSGLGSFNQPFGLDVDAAGNVYVADSNNNRVQKRSAATGTWTAWGGTRGTAVGQFNAPFDVAVDTNGAVYVADHYNHRVQKRSATGTWSILINSGFDNGQVRYPNGVMLDDAGHLFVSDHATSGTGYSRVQKFKTDGTFVEVVGSSDAADGGLWKPIFMAVSPKGDLYTADSGGNRVMRLEAGSASGTWTDVTGPHVLDEPWGVCIDRLGRLFVADTQAHRILRFDIEDAPAFVVRASLSASVDGLQLTWYGKRGWVYTVETRDSLSEGDWTPLPGYTTLSGAGELLTVDIADAGRSRQRFYRVTGR